MLQTDAQIKLYTVSSPRTNLTVTACRPDIALAAQQAPHGLPRMFVTQFQFLSTEISRHLMPVLFWLS